MNEDLVKKVTQILDTFAQEELHNRLSQFAMISLKNMVVNEIINYKPIKSEPIEVKEPIK